jgi:hypothetical protein
MQTTVRPYRPRTAPSIPTSEVAAPARLRHARAGTLALRGPGSGRVYLFSDTEATPVLAEDLDALLRTGLLEPVRP